MNAFPATLPACLVGDGEVREMLCARDWTGSPLGPPARWPRELAMVAGLMLDSNFPMFAAWGEELRFFYNDAYAVILGDKHPAALGARFEDIWGEIWNDLRPIIDDALAGRSSYFEDLPLVVQRRGDPEQAWFTFSYSPVRGEDGRVAGMYCTVIETTDRVRTERRQAFQLELADRLRDARDPADAVARASAVIGDRLGLDRVLFAEVAADGHDFTIAHDWPDPARRDLRLGGRRLDDFGPKMIDELRAGRDVAVDDVRSDSRTASHLARYEDVNVLAHLSIPLMQGGRLRAILSLHAAQPRRWTEDDRRHAHDMAERTWSAVESARAEAALRESRRHAQHAAALAEEERRRLDALLDAVPVGIAIADRAGNVVRMNAMHFAIWGGGPSTGTLEGYGEWRGWWADGAAHHGQPLAATDWGMARVLRGEETTRDIVEIEPFDAPGTRRTIVLSGAPIRDAAGRIAGGVIAQMDITDRVRAEEALRVADRRKDEFLAMLAHELRNPLAPIAAAAQLMEMAALDGKRIRQTSQIIIRQVQHMTALIEDLLDVSRVTRGLVVLERQPQEMQQVVADAAEQVGPLIDARRHVLRIDVPDAPVRVLGDRKRLVQILTNLLNNAAKYTEDGGHIDLRLRVDGSHVRLSVADDGIGIPLALQPHVFDLFAQAERTSDRSQGGLGIGLALVKSLVELHGGTVECRSGGPGHGSEFTVTLRRLADDGPDAGGAGGAGDADAGHAAGMPAATAERPLGILLVDDNTDAVAMLSLFLETLGHTVAIEHGSHAALERARQARFDVFLLDIGLPDMDGYELARQLRALPGQEGALMIAVTGYGHDEDRRRARAAGFDHHLVKPIDTGQLATLLAQARAGRG